MNYKLLFDKKDESTLKISRATTTTIIDIEHIFHGTFSFFRGVCWPPLQLLKHCTNCQIDRISHTGDLFHRQTIGFAKRFVCLYKLVIPIGVHDSRRDGV